MVPKGAFHCYNFMMNLRPIKFQGHPRCNIWENEDLLNSETDTQNISTELECWKYFGKDLGQMGKRGDHPWSPLNASKSSSNSGWVFFQKRCLFYEKSSWNLTFSCDFPWCFRWTLVTSPYLSHVLTYFQVCLSNILWVLPRQELVLY